MTHTSDSPLARLRRRAAHYVAGRPTAEAVEWIRFHGLLSVGEGTSLPSALRAEVDGLRERTLVENTARLWRFQDVVDALGEAVPVCPLKGVDLLSRVYAGDPEARPLWDVDLLVRPGTLGAAVDRLVGELGYREPEASRRVRRVSHHRWLSADGIQLELHTGLGMELWGRTGWHELRPSRGRAHDRDVYLLDGPTLLVHLLVHFAQHGAFVRLKWVEDVLRLAAAGLDTDVAWERARELRVVPAVVASVRALRAFLGDDVLSGLPGGVGLRTAPIWANERLFWRRVSEGGLGAVDRPTGWRRNASALLLSGSPVRALGFAWRKVEELWRRGG